MLYDVMLPKIGGLAGVGVGAGVGGHLPGAELVEGAGHALGGGGGCGVASSRPGELDGARGWLVLGLGRGGGEGQREAVRAMLREKKLDEAYISWSSELRARAYVDLRDPPS